MSDIKGTALYLDCANGDCQSKRDKDLPEVNLYGQASHEIFFEGGKYLGRCQVCNTVRPHKHKVATRFNGAPDFSTGKVFGSRHEQRDFAKKNGLREI